MLGAAAVPALGGVAWLAGREAPEQRPGALPDFLTPVDRFYRYTNGAEPAPDPAPRLRIGPAEAPREVPWAEVLPWATRRVTRTLQCDGNGYIDGGTRAGCQVAPPPKPQNWGWRYGGIGTAEWDVVGVGELLQRLGGRPTGWLRVQGRDGYDRHFAAEACDDPDFCVAVAMAGAPLPHAHGAPARLLVPGQYGAMQVKWIDRITWGARQEAHPFDDGPESCYEVKPLAFATAPAGRDVGPRVELLGAAFAGREAVKAVLLWEDPAEPWEAELVDPGRPYVWSRWRSTVELSPGRHRVTIACVDALGRYSRPQRAYGDAEGYGGYHELDLRVRA